MPFTSRVFLPLPLIYRFDFQLERAKGRNSGGELKESCAMKEIGMYKTPIASSMDEKRGTVENHVTECDMLPMNGALFNPRVAVKSCIQPGLYCAVPLFLRDPRYCWAHVKCARQDDQSCLQTPSTHESCCSLLLFAMSHQQETRHPGSTVTSTESPKPTVTAATQYVRMHFLTLTHAKYERAPRGRGVDSEEKIVQLLCPCSSTALSRGRRATGSSKETGGPPWTTVAWTDKPRVLLSDWMLRRHTHGETGSS